MAVFTDRMNRNVRKVYIINSTLELFCGIGDGTSNASHHPQRVQLHYCLALAKRPRWLAVGCRPLLDAARDGGGASLCGDKR